VYDKVRFFQSFTNKYSPRAGTVAYALGDPVPWQEKERRWIILNEIANKKFKRSQTISD
jgi:tRNA A37 methylthiotransferase MiaB